MLAIGFGLAWVAYGHIVYAALLITGKNVSYKQVWSLTTWPPKSKGLACGKQSSVPGYSPGSTTAPTGAQAPKAGQPTNTPAVYPTPTGQPTTAQQLLGGA
jgi:hypothetical protein